MRQLLLSLTFLMGFGFYSSAHALDTGEQAPCVDLNHINGDGTESNHCLFQPNQKGQVVVLEFFSTTCIYCTQNLPIVTNLATQYGSKATFRLVGLDRVEKVLRDYIVANKQYTQHFSVALDLDHAAKKAWDVVATPTMFIVNEDGKVLYTHIGVLENADIAELTKLIQ